MKWKESREGPGTLGILGAIKNLPVVEAVYRKFAAFSEYIKQPFEGSKVKSLHFYCTRQRKRWSPLKPVEKLYHKFWFSATLKTKASPGKKSISRIGRLPLRLSVSCNLYAPFGKGILKFNPQIAIQTSAIHTKRYTCFGADVLIYISQHCNLHFKKMQSIQKHSNSDLKQAITLIAIGLSIMVKFDCFETFWSCFRGITLYFKI